MGWRGVKDQELLALAEAHPFDILDIGVGTKTIDRRRKPAKYWLVDSVFPYVFMLLERDIYLQL